MLGRTAMTDVTRGSVSGRTALERGEPRRFNPAFSLLVESDEGPCALATDRAGDLTNERGALGFTAKRGIAAQLSCGAQYTEVARGETLIEVEPSEEEKDANDRGAVRPTPHAHAPWDRTSKGQRGGEHPAGAPDYESGEQGPRGRHGRYKT